MFNQRVSDIDLLAILGSTWDEITYYFKQMFKNFRHCDVKCYGRIIMTLH